MITKRKFDAYISVRNSALTNMYNVKEVARLSRYVLSADDVKEIIENFKKYEEEFKS